MHKRLVFLITSVFLMLSGSAFAHSGILPRPETASEPSHFIVHTLMLLPVVLGAWLLFAGVKRLLTQRIRSRQRD